MSDNNFTYKYEIAQILQISRRTMARLLNEKYFAQLTALGYEKKQKYLRPHQLKWLCEKLDFEVT
jgi:hypothetical protein